ncbi:hypothetical protein Zmor_012839 [Zophobas morio]|uniref:Uncharacterized protein n=1 Tax=Zophobas morio TaxID=2755281 RepID=A0AA38ICA0_9CUCU|nr:hypothetical protein Zmor_012839 [Zophobas morio]
MCVNAGWKAPAICISPFVLKTPPNQFRWYRNPRTPTYRSLLEHPHRRSRDEQTPSTNNKSSTERTPVTSLKVEPRLKKSVW